MSQLRRPVRYNMTSGSELFATVEDTVMGTATVRLAENGQRFTNLPVLGGNVNTGDKVKVVLSVEGQPYVRPLTYLPVEVTPIVQGTYVEKPWAYEDICGKVCQSAPQEFIVGYAYPDWMTALSFDVTFDTVLWDSGNCWDGEKWFKPPVAGRYWITANFAVEQAIDDPEYPDAKRMSQMNLYLQRKDEYIIPNNGITARYWVYDGLFLLNINSIFTMYEGEMWGMGVSPIPNWSRDAYHQKPRLTRYSAVRHGVYPVFSWHLIERIPEKTTKYAHREWWWRSE